MSRVAACLVFLLVFAGLERGTSWAAEKSKTEAASEQRDKYADMVEAEVSAMKKKYGMTLQDMHEDGTFDTSKMQGMADAGDQEAICLYAMQLAFGSRSLKRDLAKAGDYFRRANFESCTIKSLYLAVIYRDGNGVEPNPELSQFLFRKSVFLSRNISSMLKGFPNDIEVENELLAAREWYRKTIEPTDDCEKLRLHSQYLNGDGVIKDKEIAIELLKLTVGIPEADFKIYNYFITHPLDGRNLVHAIDYLHFAANYGHSFAQKELGRRYAAGDGVTRSLPEAYEWYIRANDDDAINVASELSLLFQEMSPLERKKVKVFTKPGYREGMTLTPKTCPPPG